MNQRLSETSSSSSPFSSLKEPAACSREAKGEEQDSVTIENQGNTHSALCKWKIHNFSSKLKTRALMSDSFEIGGFNCRFRVYPNGVSQALTGYCSIYLQIMGNANWECFVSYRLSIVNLLDESKSVRKDSWHRFSTEKKSHGWCEFAPISTLVNPKLGFISTNDDDDYVVITADVIVLKESVSFFRDNNEVQQPYTLSSSSVVSGSSEFLNGRFTWKVHNCSLFKEMVKTSKVISPVFPARECNFWISVYQSNVNGTEYLSMCLESKKKRYKSDIPDRSCWCLFRMSVMNQKPWLKNVHRNSYGRFATDNRGGDNTSLGWNDFMKMSEFIGPGSGFLVNDTAVFSASFQILKESSDFTKNRKSFVGRSLGGGRKSDGYIGKFTWKIDNFTRLIDLLKKKRITGLRAKSKRFQIGGWDCRLIVYPRGQSKPPCQLSLFLEVTDSRNTTTDWSCFVSHRLSIVNQRMEDKSIVKESQNRYSKAAKDWGWCNFVTLSSLFDQDSGFLVEDSIVFSAEVLILKETSEIQDFSDQDMELSNAGGQAEVAGAKKSFTWKVKNFSSFKEIMETRKIFSKFFQTGGFELRIGVYVSFDVICMYLESDQLAWTDPDKNFRVRYKIGVVNQKNPDKTMWKESSIFTNTWNESVHQFMKMSDILEEDAGFLLGDTIVFVCYIMDCFPWFEDLEIMHDAGALAQLVCNSTVSIDLPDFQAVVRVNERVKISRLPRVDPALHQSIYPSNHTSAVWQQMIMGHHPRQFLYMPCQAILLEEKPAAFSFFSSRNRKCRRTKEEISNQIAGDEPTNFTIYNWEGTVFCERFRISGEKPQCSMKVSGIKPQKLEKVANCNVKTDAYSHAGINFLKKETLHTHLHVGSQRCRKSLQRSILSDLNR